MSVVKKTSCVCVIVTREILQVKNKARDKTLGKNVKMKACHFLLSDSCTE